MSFRLTYSTMFDPPEAMHTDFEAAMQRVTTTAGTRQPLFIAGVDRDTAEHGTIHSPIDTRLRLGECALAGGSEVDAAMRAAHAAFPAWRATSIAERIRLLRRVGDLITERAYGIAAVMVLEVGKNRMEALGETQETADLFQHYADDFEHAAGYAHVLPDDPIQGYVSHNASVMRPYGPWVVIAPFNFPMALAGGPVAAALVTGNTVVLKDSPETPWTGRLLADCIRDAGFPPGVFNYLYGTGDTVGEALARHPLTAGVTFTGSVPVGRRLLRQMSDGPWPRPCITEMGGKNPCIVTEHADLERAAAGIARSAYGMGGQKCSALSRLYVHERVADALLERLQAQIAAISIGDPRQREHWLGPVINADAYANYARCSAELRARGARVLCGGAQIGTGSDGPAPLTHGYYVEPMLIEAGASDPLWQQEMFLPILMLQRVRDRDQAMRLANDTSMGLTAGFFGGADEVAWFQDRIEAGVTYANRPQGATTGAWPGYQPFVGWKGSGSTGKAMASFHYLAQYLREQSRTVVA